MEASTQRLGWIMMHAEITGLVCSGALAGKQHTYALLSERARGARRLGRDEALAELVRRYFKSHGPATVNDMRWWSSLTVADIRAGLEMVGPELHNEVVDGLILWLSDERDGRAPRSPIVHLLQPYDEYIVGYSESKRLLNLAGRRVAPGAERSLFFGVVTVDGQLAGHWKRSVKRRAVTIEVALYAPLCERATAGLEAEVARHGTFLQLDASLRTSLIPGARSG